MTLRHLDPFEDRTVRLRSAVNRFVDKLKELGDVGALPLAHGPALKDKRGRWREAIASHYERDPHAKLVLEIGCHKGKVLLELAANHPDVDVLGLDITFKRVVLSAERAQRRGLQNVYTALVNARSLDRVFAEGEVDGCLIFFPDPWVKKKSQAKNRLLDATFCKMLYQVIAPGGFVWLKTDQLPYFESAAEDLAQAGFVPVTTPQGPLTETYESSFERRFKLQNLPTYGAQWFKPAASDDFFTWEETVPLAAQRPLV